MNHGESIRLPETELTFLTGMCPKTLSENSSFIFFSKKFWRAAERCSGEHCPLTAAKFRVRAPLGPALFCVEFHPDTLASLHNPKTFSPSLQTRWYLHIVYFRIGESSININTDDFSLDRVRLNTLNTSCSPITAEHRIKIEII